MPVISADVPRISSKNGLPWAAYSQVLVLLILSLASGVLNFTLMDGERLDSTRLVGRLARWRDPRHRPSLLERQVELQGA